MNRCGVPVASVASSFKDIASEMESVFDHLFNGKSGGTQYGNTTYAPRLNVVEFEDKYEVTVDLPGMDAANIQIEFKDDQLVIAGERTYAKPTEGGKVWRHERAHGKFRRSLTLPEPINADAVDAVYDAGVLTLNVPKIPKAQPKQISIRTNVATQSAE
jgi:HSP20 family protein